MANFIKLRVAAIAAEAVSKQCHELQNKTRKSITEASEVTSGRLKPT